MVLSLDLILAGVGGAVLAGLLVWVVATQWGGARREALREVHNQFESARIRMISSRACFHGFARSWDGQWQGEGVLLLTDEMLYFRPWNGRLDISVPLNRIEEVKVVSCQGKKGPAVDHLQVAYIGVDDQLRIATWHVKYPQKWISDLLQPGHRKATG